MDRIEDDVDRLLADNFGWPGNRDDYVGMIKWFKDEPQDYWLLTASYFVWDRGPLVFRWMIEQPKCDISVAAEIFWMADPAYSATHEIWTNPENEWEATARLIARIVELERGRWFTRCGLGLARVTWDLEKHARELADRAAIECPLLPVPSGLINGFGSRQMVFRDEKNPSKDPQADLVFSNLAGGSGMHRQQVGDN